MQAFKANFFYFVFFTGKFNLKNIAYDHFWINYDNK